MEMNAMERKGNSRWKDLPNDILESVKKRLVFIDQLNFNAVCKSWSSLGRFPSPSKQFPWLLQLDSWSSCKLIDPRYKKTYTFSMEHLRNNKFKDLNNVKVYDSKFGWLLISSKYEERPNTTSLFLYTPFFSENNIVELPILKHYTNYATFSSNPLEKNCSFFAVSSSNQELGELTISTYRRRRRGKMSWVTSTYLIQGFQVARVRNWMYSDKILFYVSDETVSYINFRKRTCYDTQEEFRQYGDQNAQILKSNKEFLLIIESKKPHTLHLTQDLHDDHEVLVYRLSVECWNQVSSIDNILFFLDDGYNSVLDLDSAEQKGESNEIYSYPIYRLNHYYSLDHRLEQCYNIDSEQKSCRKLWIDPPY